MNKKLKLSLAIFGILLLSAIAGSGYIITSFDNDDYRKTLTFLVDSFTSYHIEIVEPFSCELSSTPKISMAKLKLFPSKTTDPLEFKNLRIELIPAPLLRGRLQMTVSGLIEEPKTLKWLLPKELLDLKSVNLSTELATGRSMLELNNLKIDGSNPQGLSLKLTGTGLINDFSALQPFSRLNLAIKANAPRSSMLQGYLPDNLPEIGPAKGSLRLIAVSPTALAAKDINLEFGRKDDLYIKAKGEIANIPIDPDTINTGIDFHLDLQAAATRGFAKILSTPLPEIGPVRAAVDFRGSRKESRIENITLSGGSPSGLQIQATGKLVLGDSNGKADNTLQKIDLEVAIDAPAGAPLPGRGRTQAQKLKVPATGSLQTAFKLSGDSEKIKLKDFSGHFGQTKVTAELEGSFSEAIPRITGKIFIPTLFPNDFRQQPNTTETAAKTKTSKKNSDNHKLPDNRAADPDVLFSHQPLPRNWLHLVNCDIQLQVDNINGLQKNLKDLDLVIKIDDGKLKLDPATLVFEGGDTKTTLLIDDTGSSPEIKLECNVAELNLTELLTYFDATSPVAGKLTAHTQLSSRGLSLHEIMSNISGDFGINLEEGKIPNTTLKLIVIDILGWSFSKALVKKKYSKINCCVLSLTAEKGTLEIRAFIFDSKNMTISGAGTINLAAETCHLTLYPKKKKKFWATVSPVLIKGKLRNPKILAVPFTEATMLYGGAILAPQFFLPAIGINYLWEMVVKDGNPEKNPCLEFLHQQSLEQSKSQPRTVPKKPMPAPQ